MTHHGPAGVIRDRAKLPVNEPNEIVRDIVGPISTDGRVSIKASAVFVTAIWHDNDHLGHQVTVDKPVQDFWNFEVFDPDAVIVEDAVQKIHNGKAAFGLCVVAGRKIDSCVLNVGTSEQIAPQGRGRHLDFNDGAGNVCVGLSERLFRVEKYDENIS